MRVISKDTPTLLLDGADSVLVVQSDLKIQHNFDDITQIKTVVVIAHWLSTIA